MYIKGMQFIHHYQGGPVTAVLELYITNEREEQRLRKILSIAMIKNNEIKIVLKKKRKRS